MADSFVIAGVERIQYVQAKTVKVNKVSDGKHTMAFNMHVNDPSIIPQFGNVVEFIKNSVTIYKGEIFLADGKNITPQGDTIVTCTAVSFSDILYRRHIIQELDNVTTADIVTDAIAQIAGADGITLLYAETGKDYEEWNAYVKSVGDILDILAKDNGFEWYVNFNKQVYFAKDLPTQIGTVTNIYETGNTFHLYRDPYFKRSRDGYANKVFVYGKTDEVTLLPILADAQDNTEIATMAAITGGTGVFGTNVNNEKIETQAAAQELADTTLAKKIVKARTLCIETLDYDKFQIGDKINVDMPSLGILADFTVEAMNIEDFGVGKLNAKIELKQTNVDGIRTTMKSALKELFAPLVFSVNNDPRRAIEIGAIIDGTGTVTSGNLSDFAVSATKNNLKAVLLDGDIWTDNTPAPGQVTWNTHTLVYNGIKYTITAAFATQPYIYWVFGNTFYTQSMTAPTGQNEFMIILNDAGVHHIVWDGRLSPEYIPSAYIRNLEASRITTEEFTAINRIKIGLESQAVNKGITFYDDTVDKASIDMGADKLLTITGDYGISMYSLYEDIFIDAIFNDSYFNGDYVYINAITNTEIKTSNGETLIQNSGIGEDIYLDKRNTGNIRLETTASGSSVLLNYINNWDVKTSRYFDTGAINVDGDFGVQHRMYGQSIIGKIKDAGILKNHKMLIGDTNYEFSMWDTGSPLYKHYYSGGDYYFEVNSNINIISDGTYIDTYGEWDYNGTMRYNGNQVIASAAPGFKYLGKINAIGDWEVQEYDDNNNLIQVQTYPKN